MAEDVFSKVYGGESSSSSGGGMTIFKIFLVLIVLGGIGFTLFYFLMPSDNEPQNNQTTNCTSDWVCSTWSGCLNNAKTRTCTDKNSCANSIKPEESIGCNQCGENWVCGQWSACLNGQQSRSCSDSNNCGTQNSKPATTQSCTSNCVPNWQCTNWGFCDMGSQFRTCTDTRGCGSTKDKPAESQPCGCTPDWQCGPWGACASNGVQTRTCADSKGCGTQAGKPTTSQSCDACANFVCNSWSACTQGGRCAGLDYEFDACSYCLDGNACALDKTEACSDNPFCVSKWITEPWGTCDYWGEEGTIGEMNLPSGCYQEREVWDENACGTNDEPINRFEYRACTGCDNPNEASYGPWDTCDYWCTNSFEPSTRIGMNSGNNCYQIRDVNDPAKPDVMLEFKLCTGCTKDPELCNF